MSAPAVYILIVGLALFGSLSHVIAVDPKKGAQFFWILCYRGQYSLRVFYEKNVKVNQIHNVI